mgnify:CR=1 FL=1
MSTTEQRARAWDTVSRVRAQNSAALAAHNAKTATLEAKLAEHRAALTPLVAGHVSSEIAAVTAAGPRPAWYVPPATCVLLELMTDELLVAIASNLSCPRDLLGLALSCRRFSVRVIGGPQSQLTQTKRKKTVLNIRNCT